MRIYSVLVTPAEEGGYLAYIPAFGDVTEGDTPEETLAMARDLIEGLIAAYDKRGDPLPEDNAPTEVHQIAIA